MAKCLPKFRSAAESIRWHQQPGFLPSGSVGRSTKQSEAPGPNREGYGSKGRLSNRLPPQERVRRCARQGTHAGFSTFRTTNGDYIEARKPRQNDRLGHVLPYLVPRKARQYSATKDDTISAPEGIHR